MIPVTNKKYYRAIIVENRQIQENYYLLTISWPPSQNVEPGQFVMLRPDDSLNNFNRSFDPLLPRPFSVFSHDDESDKSVISICYKVIGQGTNKLSKLVKGNGIYCLGPLGTGYASYMPETSIMAVAGGYGISPVYFYCSKYRPSIKSGSLKLLYGAKTSNELLFMDQIVSLSGDYKFATEDGSTGTKGLVTDLLLSELQENPNPSKLSIIACGPSSMLRIIKNMAENYKIQCYLSVEAYMACGIGVCLGCSIPAKEGGYKRTCIDGPVFNSQEILI